MNSETFTDEYGTRFTLRKQNGHEHVQLLITYKDGSEQTSYGFTLAGFADFVNATKALSTALARELSYEEFPAS